jgi:hypothetical protein
LLPRSKFSGQRRSVVCNLSPGNHRFLVEISELYINVLLIFCCIDPWWLCNGIGTKH